MTNLNSKIEWTDSTWSPTVGCTKVSPGCDHCYAETITERFHGKGSFAEIKLHPDRLDAPLRWRKPRRVFVNSMSDLFHDQVPDEFIARVWAVMAATPRHTYQILTKRHGRMRSLVGGDDGLALMALAPDDDSAYAIYSATDGGTRPLPNVHLGVSVEDQKRADLRIPALLDTPAAVRFISAEPLLGPVALDRIRDGLNWQGQERSRSVLQRPCDRCGGWGTACGIDNYHFVNDGCISWVIVGGESGPGARPCDPEWIRALVTQCQAAGVAAFVKQLGSHWAQANGWGGKGGLPEQWPEDLRVREFPG